MSRVWGNVTLRSRDRGPGRGVPRSEYGEVVSLPPRKCPTRARRSTSREKTNTSRLSGASPWTAPSRGETTSTNTSPRWAEASEAESQGNSLRSEASALPNASSFLSTPTRFSLASRTARLSAVHHSAAAPITRFPPARHTLRSCDCGLASGPCWGALVTLVPRPVSVAS